MVPSENEFDTPVLEENKGIRISDIPHSKIFTNVSPRAKDIKERVNKWDYIKLKIFCKAKEHISQMTREQIKWEKHICQ